MGAVGYYAVRDRVALRHEAYWYYCDRQWKLSKPVGYPSFRQWRKTSQRCSDEILDHFETTDELRELIKLSRRVSPRTLNQTVARYIDWQVFAYWACAALDAHGRLPDSVKRELKRRCPGFLETALSSARNEGTDHEDQLNRLLRWIEAYEFARACKEGWLPVVAYQGRLHPRLRRVKDYWYRWQRPRSENARSRYPCFEQWKVATDTYTFEPQDG